MAGAYREDEKSWTVVEFTESTTVEAVPTNWIIGDKCYWPSLANREKIMSDIRKHKPANTCWPLYAIRIFKDSTFDDYVIARQKAKKAEETSDLNSDVEVLLQKRKPKPRRMSSSSSDNDERTLLETPPILPSRKSPPQKPIQPKLGTETPQTRISQSLMATSNLPLNQSQIQMSQICSQPELLVMDTSQARIRESQGFEPKCNCCKKHQEINEAYFQKLIKKQAILSSQFVQLSEELANMKTKDIEDIDEQFFNIFEFPLNTYQTLEELENYLADTKNFEKAVKSFIKLGGHTSYEFIQRSMTNLMTNDMAQHFSMFGTKTKQPFNKLKIYDVIKTAAMKRTDGYDEKEIEKNVMKWLRRAKERSEYNKKK